MRKKMTYLLLSSLFLTMGCDGLRKFLIQKLGATDKYEIEGNAANLVPVTSGLDEKREKFKLTLERFLPVMCSQPIYNSAG